MRGRLAARERGSRRAVAALTAALALVLCALGSTNALAAGGAPTVQTEKAGAARTSLVLNASVNPNGSPVSECYFEYGPSESSLTNKVPCAYSPGSLETPVPVYATLEELPESTSYYFRIYAKSAEGESYGEVEQTSTLPTAPKASVETAKPVGHTSATLNGAVNPNDSEVTECYIEWGTMPNSLPNKAPCSPAPGAGSEPVKVSAALAGLEESMTYYYRVVAVNAYGSDRSDRSNFGTLPNRPHSSLEPPSSLERTSATLRGLVTPNGALVEQCYFLWGEGSLTNNAPCEPASIGSGEEPVAVTAQLTDLKESTPYEFRLVSSNLFGSEESDTGHFTTPPALPRAQIRKAQELAAESALVRGAVDPESSTITECVFEYGKTPALGKSTPCSSPPGAGERFVHVSATAMGLEPNTTYLVRVKARNAFGVTYSNNETFTTYVAGLLPVVTKIRPPKGAASGGTRVTITGENFSGAKTVMFGEETAQIVSNTADTLVVISPPGAGVVDVIVATASGENKITSADQFTYGPPAITGVSPDTGPKTGGTEVTVTGSGFEPGIEATQFVFGTAAASSVDCTSTTTCTMISPAYRRAVTVQIRATVNGKKSLAKNDRFTYTD